MKPLPIGQYPKAEDLVRWFSQGEVYERPDGMLLYSFLWLPHPSLKNGVRTGEGKQGTSFPVKVRKTAPGGWRKYLAPSGHHFSVTAQLEVEIPGIFWSKPHAVDAALTLGAFAVEVDETVDHLLPICMPGSTITHGGSVRRLLLLLHRRHRRQFLSIARLGALL